MGFESGTMEATEAEFLLAEIREVAGNETVAMHLGKYLESFEVLGKDRIRMALGDVRIASREGWARDPAAMFYAEIKRLMKEKNPEWGTEPELNIYGEDFIPSPYSLSLPQLFRELTLTKSESVKVEEGGQMVRPYAEGKMPWMVYMGPEYFTLSTNKSKSDRVLTTIRTQEGKFEIPMVRGKAEPTAEETGILTVLHERVLGALKKMWADQGCKHTTGDKQLCYARIHLRKLGEEIGWGEKFGGKNQKLLKRLLSDLKKISYYLDFTGLPGMEGFAKAYQTFEFLTSVRFTGIKKFKTEAEMADIVFSESISQQLLARHAVIRPTWILTLKNEISVQLAQYLDPVLRSRANDPTLKDPFPITLSKLIERLFLPKRKWHLNRAERKRQFLRAIAEVNGKESSNGMTFSLKIVKGVSVDDFVLTAQFVEKVTSSALAGAEAR